MPARESHPPVGRRVLFLFVAIPALVVRVLTIPFRGRLRALARRRELERGRTPLAQARVPRRGDKIRFELGLLFCVFVTLAGLTPDDDEPEHDASDDEANDYKW